MNDPPSKNTEFNETGCLYISLFPIGFGTFLLFAREANQAQLIFRVSLVGLGVIGLIIYFIAKTRKQDGDKQPD